MICCSQFTKLGLSKAEVTEPPLEVCVGFGFSVGELVIVARVVAGDGLPSPPVVCGGFASSPGFALLSGSGLSSGLAESEGGGGGGGGGCPSTLPGGGPSSLRMTWKLWAVARCRASKRHKSASKRVGLANIVTLDTALFLTKQRSL